MTEMTVKPSKPGAPADRIPKRERDLLLRRSDVIRLVLAAIFALLTFRLYALQFLNKQEFSGLSQKNVERRIVLDPVRGRFFDRNGNLLVKNEPYYRLVLDRSWRGKTADGLSMKECQESLNKVSRLLGWPETKLEKLNPILQAVFRGWVPDQFRSPSGYVILQDRLNLEETIRIEENQAKLPGVRVEECESRTNYRGRFACHLLGYVGPIPPKDYERLKDDGYRMTDWIGRMGLEREYDPILRGRRGETWQRRYANNLIEQEIVERRIPPVPGEDCYLSLDSGLQELAESLLEGKRGGIAAVDPKTGLILALASSPGFDLNLFQGGVTTEDYQRLLNDPGKPFIDRSTGKGGSGYPPGSVFKIVTAIAACEEGVIEPGTTFHCAGGIPVAGKFKRCHQRRGGHGTLDFYGGFAKSCDVYYYHLGDLLGPENIAKYARGLGLGTTSGLPDALMEKPGLVPDPAWKILYTSEGKWGRDDTLNIAIGQGHLLVTPIQIALLTSFVANGGELLEPQILSHRRDGKGNLTWQCEKQIRDSIPVSPETLQEVREAMHHVVIDRSGTGRGVRIEGIDIAGKTGTAEHDRRPSDAWFTCFAPYEDPQIAIAVVVEEGGHGGETSAPIAREMLMHYFEKDLYRESDQLAKTGVTFDSLEETP